MEDNVTYYSEIIDAALSKLKDYNLADISEEDCYSILSEYIRPACVRFTVCKKDLSNRDNDLMQFNVKLNDTEIEVLANGIVMAYLTAEYINTPMVLKPVLSSKDFHAFSNANMLKTLLDLRDKLQSENSQIMSNYSWRNSDLYSGG